jgi:cytochrome bd ubiquinol oxidase subunit I
VTTALVVTGVGAFVIRRGHAVPEGRVMLSMALWLLTALVPLQITLGDLHGLNTAEHQPAKLAAMEGLWQTGRGVPATLFAFPDQARERNRFEISIPRLGSLYLTHSWDGEVRGLKDFPPDQRPPVAVVFWAFRIMVGCGLLMLGMVAVGLWLRWRGRLFVSGWYLRTAIWTAPLGFVAVIAGWTTTEVGRQPWTVYGLMRTADSVPPSLTTTDVMLSLAAYVAVYLLMYPAGLLVMGRMVLKGPGDPTPPSEIEAGRPEQPVDAAIIARSLS